MPENAKTPRGGAAASARRERAKSQKAELATIDELARQTGVSLPAPDAILRGKLGDDSDAAAAADKGKVGKSNGKEKDKKEHKDKSHKDKKKSHKKHKKDKKHKD